MEVNRFDWVKLVGGLITVAVLALLLLVGLRGWDWMKEFLAGAAPAWIQAIGSIAAIIVGFVYTDRASQHQRAREAEAAAALKERQLLAVMAASFQAEEVEAWINMANLFGEHADFGSLMTAADEALVAFKSLSFLDIPDEDLLRSTGTLRKSIVTVQIHCRAAEKDPRICKQDYLVGFLPSFSRNLELVKSRIRLLLRELKDDVGVPP